MKKFRFIHAADLHLDSPFRGLAHTSGPLRDRLASATFEALNRIVTHAIESKSDFVVIAGDLYDSRDRSLRALVEFRQQMERLAERDIGVYVVHGNHDPLNGWGSEFKMPPNVFTFDGEVGALPVIRKGREVARVAGVSYMRERVTDNLARSFKRTLGDVYSIAVLHANIGRQSGHADYAPAPVDDLVSAGFDYWALGHVHNRSVLSASPPIVYPGNPQGRHARETGPRGCFQVDVDSNGRTRLKFIETAVVRWANLEFSIGDHSRMDSLIDGLRENAQQIGAKFDGPTVLCCRLVGNGPLHSDLQREGMGEEIQHQLQSFVDVESVRLLTDVGSGRDDLAAAEPIISDFLGLVDRARIDPGYRDELAGSLSPLFRKRELFTPDSARIEEWIEKAGILGMDLLLER